MSDEIITIRHQRYVVDQCGTCGVLFVVPELVYINHRDHGGYSQCSNGHSWGWRQGRIDADALRKERDRLKQDAARLEEERSAALAEAADAKQKLANAQRRAVSGVCPCCNRTFSNMARHMKTKHPDVVDINIRKKA